MKSIFENVIRKGGYDLAEMLAKIDVCFVEGKLTKEERDELYEMARVTPEAQYDIKTEITKLWLAIRELQKGETEGETEVKDFVQPTGAHDAYNEGDMVRFIDGNVYRSKINANVWSPDTYPSGWEIVK